MAADAKKMVVLSYQGSNKKVVIPQTKGMMDVQYLEEEFKKRFNFTETNAKVTFQRLDEDVGEYIDLEDGDEICHKEKLNAVVTPSISEPLYTEDCPDKHDISKSLPILNHPNEADVVKMKPSHKGHSAKHEQPRLAVQMKLMCGKPIEKGPPLVYKLPYKSVMKDNGKGIAKCHIGSPDPTDKSPEKVLMLLGATGTGKRTLINGMANYILGVEWEDDFRFKLIVDEPGASPAYSQTSWITSYTFHKMEGSPVPYTLTVIDTPGFGDTQGFKREKEITSQIKEFFIIPDNDGGIDHLDGIGFVTQASLARLTPTQQHIFDSIVAIFGRDIASNISVLMVTFADGSKPPVLDAIEAGHIPLKKYFKFNNAALFTKCDQKDEQGGDDDDDEDLTQMFWKMSIKSFRTFFISFAKVEPISLHMVLTERLKLERNIRGLQKTVRNALSHIDILRQEERVLRNKQTEIDANKSFTYKVKVHKTRKVDIKLRPV